MLTTFTVQTCDGQLLPVTGITMSDGSTFSDPNFSLSGGNMTIAIATSSAFDKYVGSFGIRLAVNYYNQSTIYAYARLHFLRTSISFNPTTPNNSLATCT